jgi:hypothetical protein
MTGYIERIEALRKDEAARSERLENELLSLAPRFWRTLPRGDQIRIFSAVAWYADKLQIPSVRLPMSLTQGNGYTDLFKRWGARSGLYADASHYPSRDEMWQILRWTLDQVAGHTSLCAVGS